MNDVFIKDGECVSSAGEALQLKTAGMVLQKRRQDMTFHKLLLTTAIASITGFAAHAQSQDNDVSQPEPAQEAELVPDETADMPEATMSTEGIMIAPEVNWIEPDEQSQAARTNVDRILSVADDGATVSSVDNETIGTVVSHEGGGGAEHMLIVEVDDGANIEAERLGFMAKSLKLKQAGEGLQYDYSLEQLRDAVAAQVGAEAD
ncbi:MAG: phosphoribosylglycinamide synthetase [Pseudomonadota bacterium]